MKLFLNNLFRKKEDEVSDDEVFSLMQNLDREFEMAELSVTDDLIRVTMNRIERGEEPEAEPEREMKPFVKIIYKWLNLIGLGDYSQLGIVAAALVVVVVFGVFTQAIPNIGAKSEMKSFDTNSAAYMSEEVYATESSGAVMDRGDGMVSNSISTFGFTMASSYNDEATNDGYIEENKSAVAESESKNADMAVNILKDDMTSESAVMPSPASALGSSLCALNERILAKYGFNNKVIFAGYTYDIYLITLEDLSNDRSLVSASVYEINEEGDIAGLKARFNIIGELLDFGFDGKTGFYTDEKGTNTFETAK